MHMIAIVNARRVIAHNLSIMRYHYSLLSPNSRSFPSLTLSFIHFLLLTQRYSSRLFCALSLSLYFMSWKYDSVYILSIFTSSSSHHHSTSPLCEPSVSSLVSETRVPSPPLTSVSEERTETSGSHIGVSERWRWNWEGLYLPTDGAFMSLYPLFFQCPLLPSQNTYFDASPLSIRHYHPITSAITTRAHRAFCTLGQREYLAKNRYKG